MVKATSVNYIHFYPKWPPVPVSISRTFARVYRSPLFNDAYQNCTDKFVPTGKQFAQEKHLRGTSVQIPAESSITELGHPSPVRRNKCLLKAWVGRVCCDHPKHLPCPWPTSGSWAVEGSALLPPFSLPSPSDLPSSRSRQGTSTGIRSGWK